MESLFLNYLKFFQQNQLFEFISLILWNVISFIFISILFVLIVLFLVLFERKLLAKFTLRPGPDRVGIFGSLQTLADAIKVLFKEDIVQDSCDKVMFFLAPIIVLSPILLLYALIPYNGILIAIDSQVGVLLFLSILAIPILGEFMAGYASNNKYSLIASFRAIAQLISYELPLILAALSIVILSSTMNLNDIILSQSSGFTMINWYIFPAFLGFIIFFISALAQMNRTPFDLSEAESELIGGFHTEYSGIKFSIFFLAQYALIFLMSMFISILFLGGYLPPFDFYITEHLNLSFLFTNIFIYFEQSFWLFLKSILIVFIIFWIRATLPRFKFSDLMKFSWFILIPLAILNFFIVSIIKYFNLLGLSSGGN